MGAHGLVCIVDIAVGSGCIPCTVALNDITHSVIICNVNVVVFKSGRQGALIKAAIVAILFMRFWYRNRRIWRLPQLQTPATSPT